MQSEQVEKTSEVATATKKDAEIAKPSGDCCLTGTIHEGEPRGKKTTIADVETYVTEPKSGKSKGIVLYFPDVWGFFNNGFLIMDAFADAGYTTLGLDYFQGDAVWKHRNDDGTNAPGFDFPAWLDKHMSYAVGVVPKWAEEVKSKYGKADTKVFCTGYCFGAPFVMDQLAQDGLCAAGAFGHPAFLKEHHFSNLQSEFNVKFALDHSVADIGPEPLFLSCSEIDHTFPNEFRNRAVDIMQEEKKRFQVQLFQGVSHGFALRCNLDNAYERYVKEQSLRGITEWFDFWLSQ